MKPCLLILFFLLVNSSSAQNRAGLSGQRDTSYSVWREFEKNKKNYPGLRIVNLDTGGSVQTRFNFVYDSLPNRPLFADLFQPATGTNKNRIAILIIHGGGWRSGNKEMHHPLAQKLASRGYTCLTAEYRLSTEALYPAAVEDLRLALKWIRQSAPELGYDSNRVVVLGHSAGGQLAALLGTEANAVVDIDGVLAFIHPESGEGDDSKKTSAATHWFGYSKEERPDLWQQASPLNLAGPGYAPILFLCSSVDRMHAGRDDMIAKLNKAGIYTEQYTFADAPHSFPLFHPWFDPMVNKIDGFIRQVLLRN